MYDIKDWSVQTRGGKPLPRMIGIPTPCHSCPKLTPEDRRNDPRPEKAFELTPRMKRVYYYYLLCKADKLNILPRDRLTLECQVRCMQAEEQASNASLQELAYRPMLVIK